MHNWNLNWTELKISLLIYIQFSSVFRLEERKDLGGFPYRIQVGQRLTEQDRHLRIEYCTRFLEMVYEDPDLLLNVWFSDEGDIHFDGFINLQTTRFLGFERPDVIVQKPLHRERVTIWCAVLRCNSYEAADARGWRRDPINTRYARPP